MTPAIPKIYNIIVVENNGRPVKGIGWGHGMSTRETVLANLLAEYDAKRWPYLQARWACWTILGTKRFLGWVDEPDPVRKPEGVAGLVRGVAVEISVGFPSLVTARDWRGTLATTRPPRSTDRSILSPQFQYPAAQPLRPKQSPPADFSLEDLLEG